MKHRAFINLYIIIEQFFSIFFDIFIIILLSPINDNRDKDQLTVPVVFKNKILNFSEL